MTRTNGPWTHTSDDSYKYQLSLVVAIASIFFFMEVVWSNVHLLQRVIASLYYHYAVVKQEPE